MLVIDIRFTNKIIIWKRMWSVCISRDYCTKTKVPNLVGNRNFLGKRVTQNIQWTPSSGHIAFVYILYYSNEIITWALTFLYLLIINENTAQWDYVSCAETNMFLRDTQVDHSDSTLYNVCVINIIQLLISKGPMQSVISHTAVFAGEQTKFKKSWDN